MLNFKYFIIMIKWFTLINSYINNNILFRKIHIPDIIRNLNKLNKPFIKTLMRYFQRFFQITKITIFLTQPFHHMFIQSNFSRQNHKQI